MSPCWETAAELTASENKLEFLKSLDQDDPFWVGAHAALDILSGLPLKRVKLANPGSYGRGLPPDVFRRFLRAVASLTDDHLATAIEQISRACRRDEWELWYRPILEGRFALDVSVDAWNRACPVDMRIEHALLKSPTTIRTIKQVPRLCVVEPHYADGRRIVWFRRIGGELIATVHLGNGERCPTERIETELRRVPANAYLDGLLFEAYSVGEIGQERFYVRDFSSVAWERERGPRAPLQARRTALETMWRHMFQDHVTHCELAQYVEADHTALELELRLVLEQGFHGSRIRDPRETGMDRLDLLVLHHHEYELTCTAADVQGDSLVITGTGKIPPKRSRIDAVVRTGLKNIASGIASDSMELLVGRRFVVNTPGLDGKTVLFPIFQKWIEDERPEGPQG